MSPKLRAMLSQYPWIWSLVGVIIMWMFIGVFTGKLSLNSLAVNAGIACYLAIVSLGQLFPISTGEGGIDLSIPYVVTFTAFLSLGVINGQDSRIVLGVLLTLGIGLVVGLINSLAILVFKIPPIIATMAVGFILNTVILLFQSLWSSFVTSKIMVVVTGKSIAGIPIIIIVTLVFAVLLAGLLHRTTYGRSLLAVGQNRRAAHFAGINVSRTILISYVLSSVMASIGGLLIASHVQGAFLEMGQPYLLESVGAVVVGGTLISGGKSTVVGTLLGALFLTLVVTLMETTHLPIGGQDIVEGIIILLVLSFAAGEAGQRRFRRIKAKLGSND